MGVNHIEKILNGCAILENWTAAGGSEGKSLFYYHPITNQWDTAFDAYYVRAE